LDQAEVGDSAGKSLCSGVETSVSRGEDEEEEESERSESVSEFDAAGGSGGQSRFEAKAARNTAEEADLESDLRKET
jgi:hypothetical protein